MRERELKTYRIEEFHLLKKKCAKEGYILVSASELQGEFLKYLEKKPNVYFIDISNWVDFLKQHREYIHNMESFLDKLPEEATFICEEKSFKTALEIFRYNFTSFSAIDIETKAIEESAEQQEEIKTIKKVVDLNNDELNAFLEFISKNLVGHKKFKEELGIRLKSFRLFNKLEEQKVFSIFLMGESGIGKTEVGRLMHKALDNTSGICKISFGNYSSQDSLNSLIGSPRGYVGSDDGELSIKIKRSNVGLILIDEFEKADNPVFNFFLDLLEEGKFTDSQSNVYDLDGYVLLFTSNLTPDNYKKRLSPELRSRFDYVCQFQLLTDNDKKKYMYKRIELTIQKFEKKLNTKITKEDKAILFSINYSSLNNLRKINRAIKEKFAEIAKAYIL